MNENIFYIYRHIRLDKNTPFYVGKGVIRKNRRLEGEKKESNFYKRAFTKSYRNNYWQKIVKKHGYEVEIILSNLDEKIAFLKEKEFIKLYKDLGYCEANFTLGGEGTSGLTKSKETRLKISKSHGGKSIEVYKKDGSFVGIWESSMECSRDLNVLNESIYQILHKKCNRRSAKGYTFRYLGDKTPIDKILKPYSKDDISKIISNSLKGKMLGIRNPFYNKQHSEETKNIISLKLKNHYKNNLNPRAKKVINIESKIIWDSCKKAALELGFKVSTLRNMLNGNLKNRTKLKYLEDYNEK